MSEAIEKAIELAKKCANATQMFDPIIANNWVELSPLAKKFVNQAGKEFLGLLATAQAEHQKQAEEIERLNKENKSMKKCCLVYHAEIARLTDKLKEAEGLIDELADKMEEIYPPNKHDHEYFHDDCGLCQIEKDNYQKTQIPRILAEVEVWRGK